MKKILLYIDSMAPAGGIERVISNLSNEWIKKYKVVLLVKDNGETFYPLSKDIKIINLNQGFKLNMKNRASRLFKLIQSALLANYKLRSILNKEKPDYIYTSNPLNSFEIFMLGKKFVEKLIVSEHGSKFGYNKFYNYIKSIVYPKVYRVSVPTKLDTELYKSEGYPAVYIPHLSTFKPEHTNNNLDQNVVLNIGRLTSDKQQLKLLEVWLKLKERNQLGSWKLRIVGKGEEKGNLEKFIKDNNITDSVEILKPTPNIKEVFQSSSVFAFTSKYEGFGMVLLEAMSFGVPCVSFDCPSGPRDIITDGVNGYLVENNNIENFSIKLEALMRNDNNIRKKFGENALQTVEKWSNESILKTWDELLEGNK